MASDTPDQYDEQAEKWGCDSCGCCCSMMVGDLAHSLRSAAVEAQEKVFEMVLNTLALAPSIDLAFKAIQELRASIEKDGPL